MTTLATDGRDPLADLRTAYDDTLIALSRRGARPHPAASTLLPAVRAALESPTASGTMRAWMSAHDDHRVHTFQVDRMAVIGGRPAVWAPMGRVIVADRAGSVGLATPSDWNVSRRDYAGMRVLHADASTLIVADGWHVIAYVIADDES